MTGQGGWPLNVFLTPEQVPFYAGTYFPPETAHGHAELAPGARGRGRGVGRAARRDPRQAAAAIARAPARRRRCSSRPRSDLDPAAARRRGRRRCARTTTRANGGFGGAPKFPPASALEFLLRRGETEMTAHTLRAMASGGMYDQVGGGFARYSVDAHWLVPHFEKMLYDNALLARAYLHGWQVTGDALFRARLRGDARLGAARDARPRGRLLLRARRRLGGRGGQVLRLDRRGAARGARRRATPTPRSPGSARPTRGNFEGRNILGARPGRAGSARRLAQAAVRRARRARLAGPRRQAADLLERADDRRAGRRRRGARARRLPGRRARLRRVRPRASCATPTAACCAPGRTAGPS